MPPYVVTLKQHWLALWGCTCTYFFSSSTYYSTAWSTVTWYRGSVQLLSHVQLFAIPWTTAHQASLSITNSWSLLKLMSIEPVMPSNHLILCQPLLLLPSIIPASGSFPMSQLFTSDGQSIKNFSFSISPSNEYSWLISFRIDWSDLFAVQVLSRVFSNTTDQKHQFFGTQLSLSPTLTSICDHWKNHSFH